MRIGTAVGGWLIFIGHALTLAVLREADCDPLSDQLWRGTLLFGLLSGAALVMVGRGFQWSESLRWFAVPATLLALYAGYGISPGIPHTTFGGESLCVIARPGIEGLTGVEATTIERVWPVVQLTVLALGLVQAFRYWRAKPSEARGTA